MWFGHYYHIFFQLKNLVIFSASHTQWVWPLWAQLLPHFYPDIFWTVSCVLYIVWRYACGYCHITLYLFSFLSASRTIHSEIVIQTPLTLLYGHFWSFRIFFIYTVKHVLSGHSKIGFQYQIFHNAGQTYCKMLQWEHSAILSTFIKPPFSIKTIFKWPFKTGFTVVWRCARTLTLSRLIILLLFVNSFIFLYLVQSGCLEPKFSFSFILIFFLTVHAMCFLLIVKMYMWFRYYCRLNFLNN